MRAAPTRGPWQAMPEEADKAYIRIRGTALGCRYKIANVLTPVYENASDSEANETKANARLIAAAPELLSACERLVASLAEHDDEGMIEHAEQMIAARAAIAAATGVHA